MAAPLLDPISERFASNGIQFIFVYVREPHPGENYPHHSTFEQKIANARAFRDMHHLKRPILLDDLDGTGHAKYAMLPNMLYIITSSGSIFFKSDWTDPATVTWALEQLLAKDAMQIAGDKPAPFYIEVQGFRAVDRTKIIDGIKRAGADAMEQFNRGSKMMDRTPTSD